MRKFKCIVFKIKALVLPSLICMFILFLLVFSKNNLAAAKSGLSLWANSVLPSLLPFFIATELLGYTNVIPMCGKLLNRFMRPIFNVPGEGAFALLMGIISGYPVGAKIVANLKENKLCNKVEAERLIAFTNNSGPLFIVGTVGIGLFYNSSIGLILFFTHLLSCLTVGFLFRWWGKSKEKHFRDATYSIENNSLAFCNLGEVLSKSIISSINTILMIGGFVVLFSIIISMLNTSHILHVLSSHVLSVLHIPEELSLSLLTGFIEVTNGLSFICELSSLSISFKLVICSFVLGFGGFSVLLQVLSITSKANISIKPYFIGKLLQAFFATFYTYLII